MLIRMMASSEYLSSLVTISIMKQSPIHLGFRWVICDISSFWSERLRNWRSVWIHSSFFSCGRFRDGSEGIGVEVPMIFWAHFSWIKMTLPNAVEDRVWKSVARTWRVPCTTKNKCWRPAPPMVCSANKASLGVFRLKPSGDSIAIVIFDWACSA